MCDLGRIVPNVEDISRGVLHREGKNIILIIIIKIKKKRKKEKKTDMMDRAVASTEEVL